jgi:hypothetical protein
MNGGGAPPSYTAGLFRLKKKNKIRAAAETATRPPATPPAMAPALEEELRELDEVAVGAGAVEWAMAEEAAEPINAPEATSGVSEKGMWES